MICYWQMTQLRGWPLTVGKYLAYGCDSDLFKGACTIHKGPNCSRIDRMVIAGDSYVVITRETDPL
jgi:hypothetical protein